MLTIGDVIEAIRGYRPVNFTQTIAGVVTKVEEVYPGVLFIALPEEKNAPEVIHKAFERGAKCALIQQDLIERFYVIDLTVEQSKVDIEDVTNAQVCLKVHDTLDALKRIARFWRQKLSMRVIGLIGCDGNCITSQLITDILSQRFRTKTLDNQNDAAGLALAILKQEKTTERLVVSIMPNKAMLLHEIALPQIFVMMDIQKAGLYGKTTRKSIRPGLLKFIQYIHLHPDSVNVMVLNFDDPLALKLVHRLPARVFFYGFNPQADLWADGVEGLGLEGIRFRVHYRNEIVYLHVPLIGRRAVHSVLCAVAIGIIEGMNWQEIVNGLCVDQPQLRLITVPISNGALLLDDTCDASVESALAALNLLDTLEGRKVAVLGELSVSDLQRRIGYEMVGIRAAEVVDELVVVGEQAHFIASAAATSGLNARWITSLENIQQAVEWLQKNVGFNDIVLIKGTRDMEMDRIVTALEVES